MLRRFKALFTQDGVKARAVQSSFATLAKVGGGQALRIISNLILTRLLFPEAFGLMALTVVIVNGVAMLSTVGLTASVMQNPRGDDPKFLNTVWTVQIIRGFFLWGLICLLAVPAANFYDQPMLASLLPVAGLLLVIKGFRTTKYLTGQRHLRIWQQTYLALIAQVIQIIVMALAAWWLQSVWSLVIGTLIQPTLLLFFYHAYLPGIRNRLYIERESLKEIFSLGKYLFFSTVATYAINQSDRAFLGAAIAIDLLGIYSIAYSLSWIPPMLAQQLSNKVIFPLYRMRHPLEGEKNRKKVFRARRLVVSAGLGLNAALALIAPWLFAVLYDDRYILSGPIAVLLCAAFVPVILLFGTMNTALAKGDSLRFMIANVSVALVQLGVMYLLVWDWGILGAAAGVWAGPVLTYPLRVVFLRRYKSWDWSGDLMLFCGGTLASIGAITLHWSKIQPLFPV